MIYLSVITFYIFSFSIIIQFPWFISFFSLLFFFFFSSRRRHTRCLSDWSSDVCSSDLPPDRRRRRSARHARIARPAPRTRAIRFARRDRQRHPARQRLPALRADPHPDRKSVV